MSLRPPQISTARWSVNHAGFSGKDYRAQDDAPPEIETDGLFVEALAQNEAYEAEIVRIDVDDARDAVPKAWRLTGMDSSYFKEWFNTQPPSIRLAHCKGLIQQKISKWICINDNGYGVFPMFSLISTSRQETVE